MKKRYPLTVAVFVLALSATMLQLTGCTAPQFIKLEGEYIGKKDVLLGNQDALPVDNYDYLYPVVLERAAAKIVFPPLLLNVLNKKDRIVIAPVDRMIDNHTDAQQVIERVITTRLLKDGYNVYERGVYTLKRLIIENGRFFGQYVSTRDSGSYSSVTLTGADYFLTYRLLEYGVVRVPDNANRTVKRIGKVVLEARVVDVKTARILFCDVIQGEHRDEIAVNIDKMVTDFHYKPYGYALPLVNIVAGTASVNAKEPTTESSTQTEGYSKQKGLKFIFKMNDKEENYLILDKQGVVVARLGVNGPRNSTVSVTWDCIDKTTGKYVPNGNYSLSSVENVNTILVSFDLVD